MAFVAAMASETSALLKLRLYERYDHAARDVTNERKEDENQVINIEHRGISTTFN